jgi:hypothetical protein
MQGECKAALRLLPDFAAVLMRHEPAHVLLMVLVKRVGVVRHIMTRSVTSCCMYRSEWTDNRMSARRLRHMHCSRFVRPARSCRWHDALHMHLLPQFLPP